MGAYKRKLSRGDRWFFSGQYLGKKYFSKAIYLTKGECLKAERERLAALDEEARKPKTKVMLFDAITERLDHLKERKSKMYYSENRWYLKMLFDALGNISVDQISRVEIRNVVDFFYKTLKRKGKTTHKANACIRCLKAFFNFTFKVHDLDLKNPCVSLELYSVDNRLKYIPTNEEIEAILALCDEEERFLIAFVLETGARINEAMAFSAADILGEQIVLYTRKSKNSNLTSRKIPKPMCLYNLEFKGRLFSRWTGYPRFLAKRVQKLGHKTWGWHNLRHRYASLLSNQGRPLFEIMSLLGHSNLSTTQNYLQLLS